MKTRNLLVAVLLAGLATATVLAGSQTHRWSKKDAQTWFAQRTWAANLPLQAHPETDAIEFARQYHGNPAAWKLVFDWLATHDPATYPVGKYVLDSLSVTLTITDGPSVRDSAQTRWEAHRNMVDLQYIARGVEKMGVASLAGSTVVQAYDEKKDVGFLQPDPAKIRYVEARPGTFLLFFPSDAHRPNIRVAGCDTVRKIVFKIKSVQP